MHSSSVTRGPAPALDRGPSARPGRSCCTVSVNRMLHIVAASPETFRLFADGSSETLSGVHFCRLLAPEVRADIQEQLEGVLSGTRSRLQDVPITLAGSRGGDAHLTATAVARDNGRQLEGMIVVIRPSQGSGRSGPSHVLSDMDARVLEGVASGSSTIKLADTLCLSRGGVEYHVASLARRLRVKNRPALVSKAYAIGLFELGMWPPKVAPDHVR